MWQFTELVSVAFPLDGLATHFSPTDPAIFFPWLDHGLFFAQNFQDVDILADFQNAWNNFIKTGQIWALIIGFVLGWAFRSFTGG